MSKVGRPPLKPQERRRNTVLVNLRDSELRTLKRKARAAGQPVATFLYGIVARSLGRRS